MMLADLPWYDYDSEKKEETVKVNSFEQEKALFAKYSK
jgi:hypothetical protein